MTDVLAHELPGRLRFSLQRLKGDGRRAMALHSRLAALPGVAAVRASTLTGSVLIAHDGHPATRERIIAAIAGCGHVLSPGRPGHRAAARARTSATAHPLVRATVEKLLEHVLEAAIVALI